MLRKFCVSSCRLGTLILLPLIVALTLSACTGKGSLTTWHLAPIPAKTLALMEQKGVFKASAVMIGSFKKEAELESLEGQGRRDIHSAQDISDLPIVRSAWTKMWEGDRQAPEGFYSITPASLNPRSSLYLSIDMGFPNAFDRVNGRTGSHLIVPSACSPARCYSMTDEQISETYAILRESFTGGGRPLSRCSFPVPDDSAEPGCSLS